MLLTVREVASKLRVNRSFVYALISSGELPSVRVGSIKVREEALDSYLKGKER